MAWFVWLLVGLALNIVAYLLTPRPKQQRQKPAAVQDLESPTSVAGRPVPKPFGTVEISGLNLLDARDKNRRTYEIAA